MAKGWFDYTSSKGIGGCLLNLLIIAGGTGGHITPAIALGEWRKSKGDRVIYLCGSRPLELDLYRSHGIEPNVVPLEGSPLGTRNFVTFFSRLFDILKSLSSLFKVIRKEKPDAMVLFGGYSCLPALFMGLLMNKKLIIHEQNAVAGKVTRLADRLGVPVAVGWKNCKGVKGEYTGTPVRLIRNISKEDALCELGIDSKLYDGKRIISVVGGSLGSSSVIDAILSRPFMVESSRYLYLCPSEDLDSVPEGVVRINRSWDMSPIYMASDLIVCRGGGATLAELLCCGVPAVVIPWKNSADGHQEANAIYASKLSANVGIWSEGGDPGVLSDLIKKLSSLSRNSISSDRESASRLWRLVLSHI